jgi:hypothetical protein
MIPTMLISKATAVLMTDSRVRAVQGFRSFHSVWRTIQGIEMVNMIRKGQIRWLPKHDILGHLSSHLMR